MVSIGTLLAFVIVCAGVWVLRRTDPDLPRPFRAPLVPFVPIMGIADFAADDGRLAGRHLAPAHHLAGYRHVDLFLLRPPSQPGAIGQDSKRHQHWQIDLNG